MPLATLTSPLSPATLCVHRASPQVSNEISQPFRNGEVVLFSTRRGTVSGLRVHPSRAWPRPGRQIVVKAGAARASSEERRFPFLVGSAQKLMTEIAQTVDQELGPYLQSSRTPSDVRYFRSAEGHAEGSVVLRAGNDSKVDFILESWLHASLPFGTLDIGTIVIMVGTETDSPHFLFEFILSGPVLVVVLDHLPRKDLVLDPDYLKRFYEDTGLDEIRQMFEKAPDCKPYTSPVLFVRSVVSPTAVVFRLSEPQEKGSGLLEQISNVVHPGATKMLHVWLESFQKRGLPLQNPEDMLKRDNEIKERGVEVDLSSNLPRMFGSEITSRVVAAYRVGQ